MRTETIGITLTLLSLSIHVALMGGFHLLLRRRRQSAAMCHGEILRRPPSPPEPVRSLGLISVLKPLAGHDDDLEANLASFSALTGYDYEILFGLASPTDPALKAARAFIARHPDVDARIVFTDPDAATNPKVAQLIELAKRARGDVLVTSDSNVRVASDYLVHLLAPLADPRCGLVTNLFAGTGEQTLGAALENLQLAAVITPSVVLSTLGVSITVGKSMAMRREVLERLGGFEAFADVLAEDLMIGRRIAEQGFRIATSFAMIENRNAFGSVLRTFDRHARWAKMRRSILPPFFALEPFFSPILVALVAAAVAPSRTTAAVFLLSVLVQTITAHAAVWAVRGRPMSWRYAPLEILRIFVMFACWASAWWTRTVSWRGHAFVIGAGSVITPLAATDDALVSVRRRRSVESGGYVSAGASKPSRSKLWAA